MTRCVSNDGYIAVGVVTEYSETLVRRLIEKITVYDEMLVVEFKSGLQIEVQA